MEFTAENVEAAVSQFYMTGSTLQTQAHQWLVAAQASTQAWSFVWDLLVPTKSAEVQFFAASTLQAKVLRFWHEIPPSEISNLRNRLLQTVLQGGHKIVINRLCIALACCALHSIPGDWSDPVSDLISALQPANAPSIPPDQLATLLLQILTVLPEEFQTMHLAQGRRGAVRFELQKACPQVLQLVQQWLSNENSSVLQEAVVCARAWIQLGVPLSDTENLADLLLAIAERGLRGGNDWCLEGEAAIESLTQLGTHPESSKFPGTLMRLIRKWLTLHPPALQLATQGEVEPLASVYRLLVSIAETHSRLILHGLLPSSGDADKQPGGVDDRDTCQQLVRIVLACSSTPGYFPVHETISEITFSFWYLLQDDLVNCGPEIFKILSVELAPLYSALTDTFLNKTELPTDLESWGDEERERFRCYRQDAADTLVYCYTVLDESMLVLLHERLSQGLARCQSSISDWRQLEATLHAFFAIAEVVGAEEKVHLPQFFSCLHKIPAGVHVKVVATALDAVGAYAEWINYHPSMLGEVVPLLVAGLRSADSAPSATMALKDLTRDCQMGIRPFAELILSASKEALSQGSLRHNENVRLMFAVGKVLSVLPSSLILQQLDVIVSPHLAQLTALQNQQPTPAVKAGILLRLKMLGMLCATLDIRFSCEEGESDAPPQNTEQGPQPVFLVLEKLLPDLATLSTASHWSQDEHVMNAVYGVLKSAVSTLLADCKPHMGDILTLVITSYRLNPQPSALDLAKQFLVMFGAEEEVVMQQLLTEITSSTLSSSSLSQQPDLVESLLLLLAQTLKKAPRLLLAQNLDLNSLFLCGVESLGLAEGSAVKAAVSFICGFVVQSRELAPLQSVVTEQGLVLNHKLLACIGGESSRVLADVMAEVFLILNKKYTENQARWLHHLLVTSQDQTFPSLRATADQKTNFAKAVLKERANKRRMQEIVREFSLACRGLLGTEYGSQVAPYF